MTEKKYYAVSVGRRTGIFLTWTLSNKQVNKFPGATHEGFEDFDEAVSWLESHGIARGTIEVYDKKGEKWSLMIFSRERPILLLLMPCSHISYTLCRVAP